VTGFFCSAPRFSRKTFILFSSVSQKEEERREEERTSLGLVVPFWGERVGRNLSRPRCAGKRRKRRGEKKRDLSWPRYV